jgi:hypothetical protein
MTFGVLGLAFARLRRLWALHFALWLGLVAAIGFAGAAAAVQATAADAELQSFLRGLGSKADVTVNETNKNDHFLLLHPNPPVGYRAFQAVVAERASSLTGGLLTVRGRWALSGQHYFGTINGRPYTEVSVPAAVLAAYEGIDSHMAVVGEQQPPAQDAAVPIAITETTATAMGITLGDLLCMGDLQPPLCLRVSTLWRPHDPQDPFLVRQLVTDGDLFVSIDRLYSALAAYPKEPIAAHALLDVNLAVAHGFTANEALDRVDSFMTGVSALSDSIFGQTDLAVSLRSFVERASTTQFAIQLMATQVLGLALLFVAFASGHVLGQQAQLFAAWRGRGWSSRRVFAVLITEAALMTLLAFPLGLAIAYAAAALVSGVVFRSLPYGLRLTAFGVPIGIALVVILAVLTVQAIRASRRELLDVRRLVSRPETRPWWQWRYVDLGLALLGVLMLPQLEAIGRGGLSSATDPLTAILPVVALILLTVAALRFLPLLAQLAGRAGRGLAFSMASAQFGRQPGAHGGAALVLSVGIALGVFAAISTTTESRNAADRAAYRAGSDILVSSNDQRPAFGQLTAQLTGLRGKSIVYRSSGDLGASSGPSFDLLGVDPYSMKDVAWSRVGLNATPLTDHLEHLAQLDQSGIVLSGQPKALTLWVYTTGGLNLQLAADVTDTNGQPCVCRFGAQGQAGWTQVTAPVGFAQQPTYPLRLRGLTIGGHAANDGTIAISDLRADNAEVESFSQPTGWTATDPTSGTRNVSVLSGKAVLREGATTVAFTLAPSEGDFVLRPPVNDNAIPATASTATLAAFNLIQNLPFSAYINGYELHFVIVGIADRFPTLYQEQGPWMVVALDPLLAALNQSGRQAVWPNQAWFRVDPAADPGDLALAGRAVHGADVPDRRQLVAAAAGDPLWLGLESNLVIGALTALALGVAAFAFHFLVLARGRLKEYAVLEGSGLPRALIWRSLLVEQLIVLCFSLATGFVLALLLSFALLPSLRLGNGLFDTVPSTVVTVDVALVAALLAFVALAAILTGRLAGRAGSAYRLMDELRSLG